MLRHVRNLCEISVSLAVYVRTDLKWRNWPKEGGSGEIDGKMRDWKAVVMRGVKLLLRKADVWCGHRHSFFL